jgi:MFS family permease
MVEGDSKEPDAKKPENEGEIMFLKMALYPKVSAMNILTLFLALFANRMVLSFALSFVPLLLIDVYNVPKSQVGKVAGNLGFYASLANILTEFPIGSIMDAVGRKWVSIVGFLISGLALFMMPLFSMSVFPYLYILRILQTIGIMPMINSPLFLDYIKHNTIAVSGAWISMISTLANIVSICVTLVIST